MSAFGNRTVVDPHSGKVLGWDSKQDMPVAVNRDSDAIDHPFTLAAGDRKENLSVTTISTTVDDVMDVISDPAAAIDHGMASNDDTSTDEEARRVSGDEEPDDSGDEEARRVSQVPVTNGEEATMQYGATQRNSNNPAKMKNTSEVAQQQPQPNSRKASNGAVA